MDSKQPVQEKDMAFPNDIMHFALDQMERGEQSYFVWRHSPLKSSNTGAVSLLLDMDGLLVPEHEINKLVHRLGQNTERLVAVAFFGCHASHQRQIKRKLKACDLRLFSKTAFFAELPQARRWLTTQTVSR